MAALCTFRQPLNISALMSGVMIKVAIYGWSDTCFWLTLTVWGVMILIFGTFSALLGVIYALKDTTLKNCWHIPQYREYRHYSHRYRTLPDFPELRFYRFSILALIGSLFHT